VAGLGVGLVRGGRLSNLARRPFRRLWLLAFGAGLQATMGLVSLPRTIGYLILLTSYTALAAFALTNLAATGMGLVLVGLLLNLAPIAINRGMPVRSSAIVAAGLADKDEVANLDFGGKRHLEGPNDHLRWLGDIIPDWLLHEVMSFGDLVMGVGIAALACHLLQPPRTGQTGRHRPVQSGQRPLRSWRHRPTRHPPAPGPRPDHLPLGKLRPRHFDRSREPPVEGIERRSHDGELEPPLVVGDPQQPAAMTVE
jgi:hypothetical protein